MPAAAPDDGADARVAAAQAKAAQRAPWALTFVLVTVTLDAIGIGLIFPVMPDLIEGVTGGGLSQAALWGGAMSASYAVMQFLFGPVIGSLSDRFGRRPVLLASLAAMAAVYVVMAVAQSVWVLLAARTVAGITGATHATATAFIADITPPEDRGRRFGLIGACFGLGFVLGPVVGGLLATLDTKAPFQAAAAMAAANLLLGAIVLPETVTDATRRSFSIRRANPLGALRAVGRLPGMRRSLVVFLVLSIAMNVYPSVWAFYGKAAFGWDTGMIGISLAIYGISFALGQALLVGPLIRRFGEARAAQLGMWVDITTLAAIGLLGSGTAVLLVVPFTALGGVVTPALQAILTRSAPGDAQGEVQGVLASLTAIATILSPPLMTGAFSLFTRPAMPVHLPGAPFLLAAGLMVVCVALHVATPRARVGGLPLA